MGPDDAQLARDVRDAVTALNQAVRTAARAGMTVTVAETLVAEIGVPSYCVYRSTCSRVTEIRP